MVQFTGDYSGIIQTGSTLTLPEASTWDQYALWTVGNTVYRDGTVVTITGDTTIACKKYNKGLPISIPSQTKNYFGTIQQLVIGTVVWNTVSTVATGDSADVPINNCRLVYRMGDSGDWGNAINPGIYNVAITVTNTYYYKTQENLQIDGTSPSPKLIPPWLWPLSLLRARLSRR